MRCHNSLLRGVKAHNPLTFYAVSHRDDLVFLFLRPVVFISIIQDQRSKGKTVYYFFPLEMLWFPKGFFFVQVIPEPCLPSSHCYVSTLHF